MCCRTYYYAIIIQKQVFSLHLFLSYALSHNLKAKYNHSINVSSVA